MKRRALKAQCAPGPAQGARAAAEHSSEGPAARRRGREAGRGRCAWSCWRAAAVPRLTSAAEAPASSAFLVHCPLLAQDNTPQRPLHALPSRSRLPCGSAHGAARPTPREGACGLQAPVQQVCDAHGSAQGQLPGVGTVPTQLRALPHAECGPGEGPLPVTFQWPAPGCRQGQGRAPELGGGPAGVWPWGPAQQAWRRRPL